MVADRLTWRGLNARLELPNRQGRRQWQRDDLRAALRLVGDVREATIEAVRAVIGSGDPSIGSR